MKYANVVIAAVFSLAFFSCATSRTLILSTPAVSMTDYSFPPGTTFKASGEVESTFCQGDDAITNKGDRNVGLMDEVIYKAQQDSGARYISQAQFFTQGKCMVLEGTAMK